MYNNDYIIAVDENGQPYIAHAFGDRAKAAWGSLSGRATTYIDKIVGPNGKVRYIYETAKRKGKTAAKKAWGSKAGRWIDSHDAGVTEEIMRRRLKRKTKKAFDSGDAKSARRYAHRAAELRDEAKGEREAAKESIRKRTEPIRTAAKNAYGYDEQERFEQARKRYNDLQLTARRYPDSVNAAELERRRQEMLDAQKAYTRTAKGALEYLNAKRKVRKAIKK